MRATDFVTTDGGERVNTRLHRAVVIRDAFSDPEARVDEPASRAIWWLLALAVDVVAAAALLVIVLGPK